MWPANALWGTPRIVRELGKIGIDLPRSTASSCMIRSRGPPSAKWRAFLRDHIRDIVATDLCVVPTMRNQVLFIFLILAHDRRRVLHFSVTAHPTAMWAAQQVFEAFPWTDPPKYLLCDREAGHPASDVQVRQFAGSCCDSHGHPCDSQSNVEDQACVPLPAEGLPQNEQEARPDAVLYPVPVLRAGQRQPRSRSAAQASRPQNCTRPGRAGLDPLLTTCPRQNPFAQYLIGPSRRECLDHTIELGERHLKRVPTDYFRDHSHCRTHQSPGMDGLEGGGQTHRIYRGWRLGSAKSAVFAITTHHASRSEPAARRLCLRLERPSYASPMDQPDVPAFLATALRASWGTAPLPGLKAHGRGRV